MKTSLQCLECSLHHFISLIEDHSALFNEAEREKLVREYMHFLADLDLFMPPPQIAGFTHERIRRILGQEDPYEQAKAEANHMLLEQYEALYKAVQREDDPVKAGILLAISGNIIDLTPVQQWDAKSTIRDALLTKLTVDDTHRMIQELQQADSILYLADNAGEIVLDMLLIQILLESGITDKDKITVAVRDKPIINDATIADAEEIGLTRMVRVITNGDRVPGTVLHSTSEEFKRVYHQADVIISKGMGNFETLNETKDRTIYFLLIAKCKVVASLLQVTELDFVCKRNR